MTRVAAWLGLVLLATALDASAASPAAECRHACGSAKRACVAGSTSLLQSSKADCGAAVSKDVRKSCTKNAKAEFRSFKRSCGTAVQSCKACCTAGGGPACASSAGSPVDTSSICSGITGGLAAYWDWLNGVFHPLARVPTAGGFWPPYQHPGYPLLGFRYPPDCTPTTIAAEQTVGVNLLRNDNTALWREVGTWGDVSVGVRGWRDAGINFMLQSLGNPGPVTTVCVNEGQAALAPGVTAAGSNIILTAGVHHHREGHDDDPRGARRRTDPLQHDRRAERRDEPARLRCLPADPLPALRRHVHTGQRPRWRARHAG